ncbi:MAG: SPOR domain-containing protein [Saprospiraceae bacterium]
MKKYSFFFRHVICLALAFWLGQQGITAQEIQLNEDPKVAALQRNWVNANRTNPRVDGWRVQIIASTDRTQVEEGRNRFRQLYPDVVADWVQEKPYYKLRVGAFRSKLEALAFGSRLVEYPGAYPARDANIHPRDFLE